VVLGNKIYAIDKQQVIPNLVMTELMDNSQSISLADLRGKVLYIDFWASWCIPCKKSFPFMNQLTTQYPPENLQIIAINMDENIDDALTFLEKYPAKFIVVNGNSEIAKTFAIQGLPTAFLVNQQGVLVAQHSGFNQSLKDKLILQLDYLMANSK
jgi:thiol-disulfide isomerase/thioredoxin